MQITIDISKISKTAQRHLDFISNIPSEYSFDLA